MPSKPVERLIAEASELSGAWRLNLDEVERLIRRAYRAGQRAQGKVVAKGWVGEKPEYDEIGRLCIEQEWTPGAPWKVEVRRK